MRSVRSTCFQGDRSSSAYSVTGRVLSRRCTDRNMIFEGSRQHKSIVLVFSKDCTCVQVYFIFGRGVKKVLLQRTVVEKDEWINFGCHQPQENRHCAHQDERKNRFRLQTNQKDVPVGTSCEIFFLMLGTACTHRKFKVIPCSTISESDNRGHLRQ